MKKYMFVIPTLSNGGAERVISVLATAVSEKRDVTVIKYFETPGEYPVGDKVRVINLSGGDVKAYEQMSYLRKLQKIRALIKLYRPDFVIPFMFHVSMCVALAAFSLRTTVVQSIRIDPASGPKSRILRFLRDMLVYGSKCTFVQNEKQKQYFNKKHHKKIHVLYNPVSESFFECKPTLMRRPFTVCGVGRLTRQKNFKLLIDAFSAAFDSCDEAQLLIYGEGAEKAELGSYIEEKGRAGQIRLMGKTSDLAHVFTNTDLYVLSSDYEGMPNALIEAMAASVPCISTDCPTGPADLIVDHENGLLVPVGDTSAMTEAIREIYDRKVDSAAMGLAARRTIAEKCERSRIADRMIRICEHDTK